MRPDAVTLLRELRPQDAPATPNEAALERILATPSGPPPRRRRRRRLVAVAAALTTALAGAVALPGASPDVLARAAAALADEDTILHFRSETRLRAHGAELLTREPDARVDGRVEAWQTAGGRQERIIHDGSGEWVRDWDAHISKAYNAERHEIIHHTDPDVFAPAAGPRSIENPSPFPGTVIGDLSRLLERARRGEEDVHLVGETSVRGRDVYELRIDYNQDAIMLEVVPGDEGKKDPRTVPVKAWRTIYVDRERFLPVRVVEGSEWKARGGEVIHSITDYLEIERLPRTPENERLLQMSPHPGAKEVREGRV